jgi:hypothetical protein
MQDMRDIHTDKGVTTLPVGFNHIKHTPMPGGGCWVYRFDNNYGASVICHQGSYGGNEGLFEIMVAQFPDHTVKWHCPSFSFLDEVGLDDTYGWLTLEDVARILGEINALGYQA